MKIRSALVAIVFSGSGCGTLTTSEVVKDIEQCEHRAYCAVEGIMSIEEINHVHMGQLITEAGKCINVSLPSRLVKKYSKSDGKSVFVRGLLYRTPVMEKGELTLQYKIDGRRVGWDQCGEYYLFVTEGSDVKPLAK